MKSIRVLCLVFSFATLLAPAARAQFAVFDASNFGEAVQEFGQLEQMYTTAVETRDQIIAAYNLAYQMSQMPQDLAARYASDFTLWTNLSAPNTYGNTSAWVNALDLGSPSQAAQGYRDAVVQVQSYPGGSLAAQDAATQATIQNQYATSELAQGTTTSPCRAVASADAALVAPTHVLDEYRIRTVPVRTEYQNRSRSRTQLRPDEVQSLDLKRYLNRTEISTNTGRDCGERGNNR